MKEKILNLSCGSKIEIYQDVFEYNLRTHFLVFVLQSKYWFGRGSSINTRHNRLGSFFSCEFSADDDRNFGFNETEIVKKLTKNYKREKSWVNASLPGSWYYTHSDSIKESLTLLYPINVYWDTEHGGETLFYNSYGEKEIAVDFIPGQIIKFDGRIPHKPAMISGNFEPRFMYTCQYSLL
jgi:hypothetical protein